MCAPLIHFLQTSCFGIAQWSYKRAVGARDLVTIAVAGWVRDVCEGRKVGVYMADISGAFDRVARELLLSKLASAGVPSAWLSFLNSYLLPREGRVTVEGAMSQAMHLSDMVFQGTVLGPCLWNAFFHDVVDAVAVGGQVARLFADDLSVSTSCASHVSDTVLLEELREAQSRAHTWGVLDQVSFDASKEHLHIIHPTQGMQGTFRKLGTVLDCRLAFDACVDAVLARVRPKAQALLKIRHLYSVNSMLHQFRAHILCHLEYSQGALINASPAQLGRLDTFQANFLRVLGVSVGEAFVRYNLAPPCIRRAIGILGFLHKRVHGPCHPGVRAALPMALDPSHAWHNLQMQSCLSSVRAFPKLFFRSLHGYVLIYNRLPQEFVEVTSVKDFQGILNKIAKCRAEVGDTSWMSAYQSCRDVVNTLY